MNNYRYFLFAKPVGQNSTERKIRAFAKLQPGWRLGGGKSFSESVLESASQITMKAAASGFLETDAFPGRDGDVGVVIYDDKDYYEFSIRESSINFLHEQDDEIVSEKTDLTLQDALGLIPKLKEAKWNTFFIFTSAITTENWEDFVRLPSRNQVMEAEFQSYPANVSFSRPDAYVFMPSATIQRSHINRPCFGNSVQLTFSTDANLRRVRALPTTHATQI